MVKLVDEGGCSSLRVRDLASVAGVSTRALYKRFGSVEDCFVSTHDWLLSGALRPPTSRSETKDTWETDLRISLRELATAIARRPGEAHLVLVDPYALPPGARRRLRSPVAAFEDLLRSSFSAAGARRTVAPRLLRAMAAGAVGVARSRVASRDVDELPRLADELADWAVSLSVAADRRVVPHRNIAPRDTLAAARSSGDLRQTSAAAMGDERGRILVAVLRIAAADGYASLTVPKVRAEAGVSRRAFDARFDSTQDAFLVAVEELVLAASVAVERTWNEGGEWEQSIYRSCVSLCAEVARNQALARVVLIEILEPGVEGSRCRDRLIATAASRLRAAAPPSRRPSQAAAEASIAAAWELVAEELAHVGRRDFRRLPAALARVLVFA
ncbi:MAG TPA: TetR family transcriptional regulator [Solirubrobacterales bacterium]|nr:TetR family transcriptional regulator [Solirubrobacterales bacterium]